jgi:trehalose 6-phosphate phosphatase
MTAPLPRGLLAQLAGQRGLLLCLDYDGTLAEIAPDPDRAVPVDGVREALGRLVGARTKVAVAIVTGRRIAAVRRLLGIERGLGFSGVHGLEFVHPDGAEGFTSEALACVDELATVRRWLAREVPRDRGFWIEDKQVALGLHYRAADPVEARALCDRFAAFVATNAPRLKLLALKMLAEAMPRAASKGRALAFLRSAFRSPRAVAYFGDDTTDEDAFAALGPNDLGVFVGADRPSRARYRVDNPAAVAAELAALADAVSPA